MLGVVVGRRRVLVGVAGALRRRRQPGRALVHPADRRRFCRLGLRIRLVDGGRTRPSRVVEAERQVQVDRGGRRGRPLGVGRGGRLTNIQAGPIMGGAAPGAGKRRRRRRVTRRAGPAAGPACRCPVDRSSTTRRPAVPRRPARVVGADGADGRGTTGVLRRARGVPARRPECARLPRPSGSMSAPAPADGGHVRGRVLVHRIPSDPAEDRQTPGRVARALGASAEPETWRRCYTPGRASKPRPLGPPDRLRSGRPPPRRQKGTLPSEASTTPRGTGPRTPGVPRRPHGSGSPAGHGDLTRPSVGRVGE